MESNPELSQESFDTHQPSPPPEVAPIRSSLIIREGDMVILLTPDMKRFTVRAGQGEKGTHYGQVRLSDLVGKSYGTAIHSRSGNPVYLLRMTLQDHIMCLKRLTQIIYPKDTGAILLKLGIGAGSTVLECGTGSGALTMALAWMVGPTGRIHSYEREKAFSERAEYNLRRAGLLERVTLRVRNLEEADFDDQPVDAAFLDVREPPNLLDKVSKQLSPGGILGILVPTMNQVAETLRMLEKGPYIDTEIMETFVRKFKVNAERLRPEDRMIGHTGYLLFTRRIEPSPDFVPVLKPRSTPIAQRKLEGISLHRGGGVSAPRTQETSIIAESPLPSETPTDSDSFDEGSLS